MSRLLIMLGSGGHAKNLAELLESQGRRLYAIVSPGHPESDGRYLGARHFQDDHDVLQFSPKDVELVNGLGSVPGSNLRFRLYQFFYERGYHFPPLVSNSAIVSSSAQLSEGVQVMHRAIIQADARIGANSIINTGAIVEHDCQIGEHNHLAPGVTLSGGVCSDPSVHFGTGSSVIQGIRIGTSAVIAAGCAVYKDLPAQSRAMAQPMTIQINQESNCE